MSTTARRYWLKLLRAAGVKHFRAKSGLGLPYICYVGDFAGEAPFYNHDHSVREIAVMAAWCADIVSPVIVDIGANLGFLATQLAQLLEKRAQVICFEPTPSTFAKLARAIVLLELESSVIPLNCAISDSAGILKIAYNPKESLFAQIRNDRKNSRAGHLLAYCPSLTLDNVFQTLGIRPNVVKIDVEGFENHVLRGGRQLFGGAERPALLFEWNPLTMEEVGTQPKDFAAALADWRLYYVDDFEGQKKQLGEAISKLSSIDWVCNIFAVPSSGRAAAQWRRCISTVHVPE